MKRVAAGLAAMLLMSIAMPAQADTVEYIHTDALGTPIAVTNASGTVIQTSEYAPYGQLLNRSVTDGPGYTGHVEDAATGLTYMQQRYYDPKIGRMLSVDPITADSGGHFNRYWYAEGNSYKFTDPDGRRPRPGGPGGSTNHGLVYMEFDNAELVTSASSVSSNTNGGVTEIGASNNDAIGSIADRGRGSRENMDWVKFGAAMIRAGNSGRLGASGLIKMGVGGAASATGEGAIPGVPTMVWAAWNLRSSLINYQQAYQLLDEAQLGSRQYSIAGAARVLLIGGFLPYGTLADDPGEPRYDQVLKQKFYESPHKVLLELGSLSP